MTWKVCKKETKEVFLNQVNLFFQNEIILMRTMRQHILFVNLRNFSFTDVLVNQTEETVIFTEKYTYCN